MFAWNSVLVSFLADKMIDPVNPPDKVVVVAVMVEEENAFLYIIGHVTCALLRIIFEI